MAGTILFASWGQVEWDGPTIIDFGNGGQLQVTLFDAIFNGGPGLEFKPGYEHGAIVKAKFKLLSDTTPIPLPASLPLLGAALAGLALVRRRRGDQA